jgi:hypothetical protein
MDYQTIHDPFYRAPEDKEYFSFTVKPSASTGLIEQFRCFIPPGTVLMDLNIIETGKQQAIARFGQPPADLPLNEFFPSGSYYSLDSLAKKECLVVCIAESSLYIANDAFDPPLNISRAGWLYVKIGYGQYSDIYDTHFTVRVNVAAYNAWWDQYIVDAHGWQQYVENVITYQALTPIVLEPVEPVVSTVFATLDDNWNLHIPDILLPDGKTHVWADLQLVTNTSNFAIKGYGIK